MIPAMRHQLKFYSRDKVCATVRAASRNTIAKVATWGGGGGERNLRVFYKA